MSKPESEFTKPSDLCTVKNQPRDGSGPRTSAFCRNIAHISRLSLKNSFVSALNSEPQKTKLGRSRALLYVSTNRLTECRRTPFCVKRSEEHTSELQSRPHLVCRLLLEKKKK